MEERVRRTLKAVVLTILRGMERLDLKVRPGEAGG